MTQLEFKFFWPLTEQIPLDLDYTDCNTKNPYISSDNPFALVNSTGSVGVAAFDNIYSATMDSPIILSTNALTLRRSKKPNLIARMLFKILNIKWEVQ